MVSKSQQQFWKHDVKVARDYNKTFGTGEGESLKAKIFEDLAKFRVNEFRSSTTQGSGRFSNQHTWSPMMRGSRETRISIQELEKLYTNPSYNTTDNRPTKFVETHCHSDNSFALIQYLICRRLNRVGVLGRSLSPTKYQPLKNDAGNDGHTPNSKRCLNMPSKSLHQQRLNASQVNPDIIRETNETQRKRSAGGEVQSKSKFIVTRAVDPLHFNKNGM